MGFKEILKKLKESKEFKEWNKKNKDVFLSYVLKMSEGNKETSWQFGFYHKSTEKIATFTINKETIDLQEEDEVFKKPDMKVRQIDLEKAKLPFKEISEKAEGFRKEKYPKELTNKTIAILQNLEEYGTIWNMTYITLSFNTINIKADAESGKILHYNMESLISFDKK